jgi:hypothetical protein
VWYGSNYPLNDNFFGYGLVGGLFETALNTVTIGRLMNDELHREGHYPVITEKSTKITVRIAFILPEMKLSTSSIQVS